MLRFLTYNPLGSFPLSKMMVCISIVLLTGGLLTLFGVLKNKLRLGWILSTVITTVAFNASLASVYVMLGFMFVGVIVFFHFSRRWFKQFNFV